MTFIKKYGKSQEFLKCVTYWLFKSYIKKFQKSYDNINI